MVLLLDPAGDFRPSDALIAHHWKKILQEPTTRRKASTLIETILLALHQTTSLYLKLLVMSYIIVQQTNRGEMDMCFHHQKTMLFGRQFNVRTHSTTTRPVQHCMFAEMQT